MSSRPKIPAEMKRAVLQEAGYRCAVPTCRDKGPFDFEHIEPWAKVQKHEFSNIILLCVGCHARVTRKEISKSAIKAYKRNLAIISGRYSLYEFRYLERLHQMKPRFNGEVIIIDGESVSLIPMPMVFGEVDLIHMDGLIKDRMVSIIDFPESLGDNKDHRLLRKVLRQDDGAGIELLKFASSAFSLNKYMLTPTPLAIQFVNEYFSGKEIQ